MKAITAKEANKMTMAEIVVAERVDIIEDFNKRIVGASKEGRFCFSTFRESERQENIYRKICEQGGFVFRVEQGNGRLNDKILYVDWSAG